MNYAKTIRDPMYGYITIEAPFAQLLDTEEFQRLRNIRQTGYQSLYPSALHNRFVHSLGVFHLGKKALGYFENNINIQNEVIPGWDEIRNTFLTACLLHDVKEQLEQANSLNIKADSYLQALNICDIFTSFQDENHLKDFEFVVLFTRKFQSAYKKTTDLNTIKIELETGLVPLNDVISVQAKSASRGSKLDLFYVYTTKSNIGDKKDLGKQFIDCLRRNFKSLM